MNQIVQSEPHKVENPTLTSLFGKTSTGSKYMDYSSFP